MERQTLLKIWGNLPQIDTWLQRIIGAPCRRLDRVIIGLLWRISCNFTSSFSLAMLMFFSCLVLELMNIFSLRLLSKPESKIFKEISSFTENMIERWNFLFESNCSHFPHCFPPRNKLSSSAEFAVLNISSKADWGQWWFVSSFQLNILCISIKVCLSR